MSQARNTWTEIIRTPVEGTKGRNAAIGAVGGGILGGIAAAVIGGVGIAAMGTGIGAPAGAGLIAMAATVGGVLAESDYASDPPSVFVALDAAAGVEQIDAEVAERQQRHHAQRRGERRQQCDSNRERPLVEVGPRRAERGGTGRGAHGGSLRAGGRCPSH